MRDGAERYEAAMDRMFRCIALYRQGGDYGTLLEGKAIGGGRIAPMTFVACGYQRLWSGRSPAQLRRMWGRADLRPNLTSVRALIWVLAATTSPKGLRAVLRALLAIRNLAARLRIDGDLVEWQPQTCRPTRPLDSSLNWPVQSKSACRGNERPRLPKLHCRRYCSVMIDDAASLLRTPARLPARLLLHAEVLGTMIVASALLRMLHFNRIAASASAPLQKRAGLPCDVRRLRSAVEAWSRRVPWRALCFEKALCLRLMLRRRGVAPVLHYGIAPDGAEKIKAHVWLTVDGIIAIGGETASDFACVATFPPATSD